MAAALVQHYVGLPWRLGGRDRDGLDCWGLVRLVYSEVLGIELPSLDSYDSLADRAAIADLIGGQRGDWQWIEPAVARPLDVAVFREGGAERHVGLLIRGRRLLHIPAGERSRVEPISPTRFGDRLEGFHRHARAPERLPG